MQEATVDFPAVLRSCRVDDVFLVGHSDGGTIALLATSGNAALRIRGIVTEAAHVFVEPVTIEGIRRTVENYKSAGLADKLSRYHGSRTDRVFFRWADRWLAEDFFSWNVERFLARVSSPLLAIQGEDDPYGSPEQLKRIADGVAGPTQVALLPRCGHTPHKERPRTVLRLCRDFIDRSHSRGKASPGE
jgi:pimeloyl-ACP methyl ester carboxylesterase